MGIIEFAKKWTLPIAMGTGIAVYLIYDSIPALSPAGPFLEKAADTVQPVLIFIMLFLSFCRISPRGLRPRKWHLKMLLFQCGTFVALAVPLALLPDFEGREVAESAMLCVICPTATAAAVVTGKLGGDMSGVTTYTVLINIAAGMLIPAFIPLVHPVEGISFFTAFSMIMARVFPLLICPCLLAWSVRYLMPHFHRWILRFGDLAFYIWGVSLSIAIAVTTRSIVHNPASFLTEAGIAAVSLACCILQFQAGKSIGRKYNAATTAGQALGQKNTVLAIWIGYTFMTPVTSVAGGFYCIWHNAYNSWQLYRKGKAGGSLS